LAQVRAGFPAVFAVALPAYRRVLAAGGSANQARVQAFFVLLATLDDTNLLHRAGAAGLAYAREASACFLAADGVFGPHWREQAIEIHRQFCRRGLSPGGSADLLAACVFMHSLRS
jgi:triphosphoribosyl-dephospho-CoA synthase